MEERKMIVIMASVILFVILNLQSTYKLTNKLTKEFGFVISVDGCPNIWGLTIHTLLYFLIMILIVYY